MRDDFSSSIKEILARRVGMRCSNPNCRKPTSGPREEPSQIINIGVAAHITAASPGGPRYDSTLSSEDRKAITNGLWLCQNCAKLVDNDEHRYTIDLLYHWKELSEKAALLDIERNAPSLTKEVGIDIRKEKLNTYLSIGHQLGLLGKEIDLVQDWTRRIMEKNEIAELSYHFPATGSIERLHARLAEIEELRIKRRWLLAWKIDALLYAISLKGKEMLAAIECYGNEKDDWQLKRGHLLAASSIANVVSEYASICSGEADEDLRQRQCTLSGTPSDGEAKAFFKDLGDMGRAESKRFSDENTELVRKLREANQQATEQNARDFKFKLQSDMMLAPESANSIKLNPLQRIEFLDKLYGECLGFYFRMWNEPQDETKEKREQLRLEQLLQMQSTNDILDSFRDMVSAIRNTFTEAKPLATEQFENQDDFEKARLEVLRPSAKEYDRLQGLTELHMTELKQASRKEDGVKA